MVDLKTAMAAAQAERMKRDGAKNAEKKKRRSGADLGIEPFDPVKYQGKERADTASMWLVIVYAVLVTAMMRYILMPSTTLDKTDVLYILPLSMLILIPQLHRLVMPERFKEHYTKGTWFRAIFLYIFTFLSLSFLVVNPPFGDIVAPQLADEWAVVIEHDGNYTFADKVSGVENEWNLDTGERIAGGAWVLFGLADNVDHTGANVTIQHTAFKTPIPSSIPTHRFGMNTVPTLAPGEQPATSLHRFFFHMLIWTSPLPCSSARAWRQVNTPSWWKSLNRATLGKTPAPTRGPSRSILQRRQQSRSAWCSTISLRTRSIRWRSYTSCDMRRSSRRRRAIFAPRVQNRPAQRASST